MSSEQRISLRQVTPNPLFEQWLGEWMALAESKDSMRKHSMAKALESMRRYPLVLHSGRDCSILDGFGPIICRMLDKQLEVYRNNVPDGSAALLSEAACDRSIQEVVGKVQDRIARNAERKRLKKKQPQMENFVVQKVPKISATATGNPFEDLYNKYKEPGEADEDVVAVRVSPVVDAEAVVVPANTYEIVFLVDTQETAGKSKRSLDTTIKELERNRVRYEVRRLSVGDFLWIARSTSNNTSEFVLPYIVERKRMDDLAGSIKDGRFHEQKFRLSDSGIANVIYMIESHGNNQHVGMPLQNLMQAATNTQVQSGFAVKFTNSHVGSMRYLVMMTELLKEVYANKSLVVVNNTKQPRSDANDQHKPVLDFKQFNTATTKMRNFPIKDMFVRQLLQLKTLTLDKALAIVQQYPTPSRLLRSYAQCTGQRDAEMLLANISYGPTKKTIGPVISKCLYQFYHAQQAS